MIDLDALRDSYTPNTAKIVLLVADGLGGVPHPETRKTELETASKPNLDALASQSACGLTIPIFPGIAPGSGPGHLALFGYDPLKYFIGRGVLEVLGIGVHLKEKEIAVRGNFCTVDSQGIITDRRAGRIPTVESAALCERLKGIEIRGIELSVYPVKDHRFALVVRGDRLDDRCTETDPQQTGVQALPVEPAVAEARYCADILNRFVEGARAVLKGRDRANMVLLRGISKLPHLPPMGEVYRIKPAAIASYPMYRGLAQVMGMQVIPTGNTFEEAIRTLEQHFSEFDFFFVHYKATDAAGEDGDFGAKIRAIEAFDSFIPRVRALKPDVLIVACDHSTPALLAKHSWHPAPFLLHSKWTLGEGITTFCEKACASGSLGTFSAVYVMAQALSHAGKLSKFGP